MLSELLSTDDLVLVSDTIKNRRKKIIKWKEALGSKGVKVNHGQRKVVVSGDIRKSSFSKSKDHSSGVYSLRAKANSILCTQRGKWNYGGYAGVKMLTT